MADIFNFTDFWTAEGQKLQLEPKAMEAEQRVKAQEFRAQLEREKHQNENG